MAQTSEWKEIREMFYMQGEESAAIDRLERYIATPGSEYTGKTEEEALAMIMSYFTAYQEPDRFGRIFFAMLRTDNATRLVDFFGSTPLASTARMVRDNWARPVRARIKVGNDALVVGESTSLRVTVLNVNDQNLGASDTRLLVTPTGSAVADLRAGRLSAARAGAVSLRVIDSQGRMLGEAALNVSEAVAPSPADAIQPADGDASGDITGVFSSSPQNLRRVRVQAKQLKDGIVGTFEEKGKTKYLAAWTENGEIVGFIYNEGDENSATVAVKLRATASDLSVATFGTDKYGDPVWTTPLGKIVCKREKGRQPVIPQELLDAHADVTSNETMPSFTPDLGQPQEGTSTQSGGFNGVFMVQSPQGPITVMLQADSSTLIGTFVTVDGSGNLSGSVMGTTASGYVVAQDGSGTFEAKISGDDLSLRLRFRTYLGQEGDIPLRLRRQ